MKKYILVLLLGLVTMVGGCVPFGMAILNATNANQVLHEAIPINKNYQSSVIHVDTNNFVMPALKIHLTSNEISKNTTSQNNEYDAKYRFPINLIISDKLNTKIHEYNGKLDWSQGTKTYELNAVNARQGEVIVEIDLDKILIPEPGDIKISVFVGDDTFYYAKLQTVDLLIYDNIHKHTSNILTGIAIIIGGIIIFIFGLVMVILKQSTTPKTTVPDTMNKNNDLSQDDNENQNTVVNTTANRSSINTSAMLCHLATFAGLIIPFGGILGPLIMWQIKKDDAAFINRHGIAAVNFHLSMAIYYFVSFLLAFIIIGFFFLIILAITDLILTIIASIKASNGEEYKYPLTIQFIKIPN